MFSQSRTARLISADAESGVPFSSLPEGQRRLALARLVEIEQRQPLRSDRSLRGRLRYQARIAGITSAFVRGLVGNERWGRRMKGKQTPHDPAQLRAIQAKGLVALERLRARRAWEKAHPDVPRFE